MERPYMRVYVFFFFFFCGSYALFTRLASTFFNKNNFQTGLHGTIHILLQYFQFSVINDIQTNTKCDCVRQVAFINPKVTVDSSESFSKLPQTISHLLEFFLGSSEGDLSLLDWHGS